MKGLELDEKTLALIDADGDSRIRVPELLAAIKWAAARVNDPSDFLRGAEALPLTAINASTADGKVLFASAKQILVNLGKKDAATITVADAADTAKIFSASALNGDGVIPPEATDDPAVQALIKEIVACAGGTADRTGSIGVTAEKIDAFFAGTRRNVPAATASRGISGRSAPHPPRRQNPDRRAHFTGPRYLSSHA